MFGNKLFSPEDIREQEFQDKVSEISRKNKKSPEELARLEALKKLTGFYSGESFASYVPESVASEESED